MEEVFAIVVITLYISAATLLKDAHRVGCNTLFQVPHLPTEGPNVAFTRYTQG